MIYMHAQRTTRSRWFCPRIFLNGREVHDVLMFAALWNGGPGMIEQYCRNARGEYFLDDSGQRVVSQLRFGLVRAEEAAA